MPVGAPDGGYPSQQLASSVLDTGALGDRLLMGGGAIFKVGRVIWGTGFENGIFSDMLAAGPAGEVVIKVGDNSVASPKINPWQGSFCAMFTTVAADTPSLFKYFPATIQTGKWGLEAMISAGGLNGDNPANNTNFDIIMHQGQIAPSSAQIADIRFIINAAGSSVSVQYKTILGSFTQFAQLVPGFALNNNVWYNMKLVVDFGNGNYSKFYINNKPYDLSGVPLYQPGGDADERSFFQFAMTAQDANPHAWGVDNVILTADEP